MRKLEPPADGTWKPKHVGQLISTTKTAYEHLLDISHPIKNARYNDQDTTIKNISFLHKLQATLYLPHGASRLQLQNVFFFTCEE
jgi:hypothetical protein